jgi:hypothetical protein
MALRVFAEETTTSGSADRPPQSRRCCPQLDAVAGSDRRVGRSAACIILSRSEERRIHPTRRDARWRGVPGCSRNERVVVYTEKAISSLWHNQLSRRRIRVGGVVVAVAKTAAVW